MKNHNIQQTLKSNKIGIIGAGASGLFCGILLAKKGFQVSIFEQNIKVGRKLLATGNGKCNISNTDLSFQYFHSSQADFYHHALKNFDFQKFEKLVFSFGLDLVNKNGKIYPYSDQASSVVDVLYSECLANDVRFYLNHKVDLIDKKDNFIIVSQGKKYHFDRVIIATGSGAMKKLGSSTSGYDFAQFFGHSIIEPIPSLVQLESDNTKIKRLQGVKIEAKVTLKINKQDVGFRYGDILFAKYGVSGNTILDLSREASIALNNYQLVMVEVDIFPNQDKNSLLALLEKKQKHLQNKEKEYLLLSLIHSKMIEYIFEVSKISREKIYVKDLSKKDLLNLVSIMSTIDSGNKVNSSA